MRGVGCIGKRKFTNDVSLIRHLKSVIDRGKIAAFYPEARYSLCGTNAVLPESLGKMVKMFKVPVATLITHGHHIDAPFWKGVNPRSRMLKTIAEQKLILTPEQIESMSVDEINQVLNREFEYDDFKWQKENKVRVSSKKRAEGLEHVLYKCPHCGTEYRMSTKGLVHNNDGFLLASCWDGKSWELKIPTTSLYSVHIEYNYKKLHRDCIDLSTLDETFFVYPKGSEFSVTKISLATEELFKNCWGK